MKIESVPLKSVSVDPSNVRRHPKKNLEAIVGSLRKFGQQKPIVVSKDGVVLAGNGTLEAARELGWKKIDIVRTPLKGSDAAAYSIADNRTGELATWDYEGLATILKGLDAEDFDLESLGWEAHELEPLLNADFNPGEPGEMPGASETVPPIKVTAEERAIFEKTIKQVFQDVEYETEGVALAALCAKVVWNDDAQVGSDNGDAKGE